MTTPHFPTSHADQRARERLDIDDGINAFLGSLKSLIKSTLFLSVISNTQTKQHSYRLIYLDSFKKFAVLLIATHLGTDGAESHTVVTTYTVSMYEENTGKTISALEFRKAAFLTIHGEVESRKWEHEHFGTAHGIGSHKLKVWFEKGKSPVTLKVRSSNCADFKKYASDYDILSHPGALTAANKQLEKFGKTLNDRLYMRYDGRWSGLIKLQNVTATKCQYCGLEPLDTDVSAIKSEIDILHASND
jgi:hypothetical protein